MWVDYSTTCEALVGGCSPVPNPYLLTGFSNFAVAVTESTLPSLCCRNFLSWSLAAANIMLSFRWTLLLLAWPWPSAPYCLFFALPIQFQLAHHGFALSEPIISEYFPTLPLTIIYVYSKWPYLTAEELNGTVLALRSWGRRFNSRKVPWILSRQKHSDIHY